MDTETFGRLAYEFSEVASRLHSLQEFIGAEPHFILDQRSKDLLDQQKLSMQAYVGTLLERIEMELDGSK